MTTNSNASELSQEEQLKDSCSDVQEEQESCEQTEQPDTEEVKEEQAAEEIPAETVEEEKEDGDAKYLRLAADFQNFRRRVEKEKSDIYAYANEKIALDIIDVMDNFERALQHSEECADKQFAEGVSKIYKQLKGVLDKNNIVEIKTEGEDFDPNFHNAVTAEDNPEFESGKIIQALQKGYTLNGKVIRPSMVRVAQ